MKFTNDVGSVDFPVWATRSVAQETEVAPRSVVEGESKAAAGRRRLRVSVIPNHPSALQNRLFSRDFVVNSNWMDANIAWYQSFANAGVEMATIDMLPAESADVVIVIDLPAKRSDIIGLKQRCPKAKFLLSLYESPFEKPHWFDRRNHREFDAILTYNPKLAGAEPYRRFYLPVGDPPEMPPDLPFEERRPCVLLSTNYYCGILDRDRPWHWLTGYRCLWKAGWKFGIWDIVRAKLKINHKGRRSIARAAEKFEDGLLDVYGSNWNGKRDGWYHRMFPDRPYKASRGPFSENKLKLLSKYRFVVAYENYVSDDGYISEKVFDALYAGAVPIYCGDASIADYVDEGCFVDGRRFGNPEEVLRFVSNCSRNDWEQMYRSGRAYLRSNRIRLFQPAHFASTMLSTVLRLADERLRVLPGEAVLK